MDGEDQAIWNAMRAIYSAVQGADYARADENIAPEATFFDSAHRDLIRGKAELDAVRAQRPTPSGEPTEILSASDPTITRWDDIAYLCHWLTVRTPDGSVTERYRNTSIWRRIDGTWLMVHNHEGAEPAR